VFGAQVGDQLGDFCVRERVTEGRHLLAAVHNLIGQFGWSPELVVADAGERWGLWASDAAFAVAVSATFIAEEDGAGLFVGPLPGVEEGMSGRWGGEYHGSRNH